MPRLRDAGLFQVDPSGARSSEEPDAVAEQDWREVIDEPVDEPFVDALPGDLGTDHDDVLPFGGCEVRPTTTRMSPGRLSSGLQAGMLLVCKHELRPGQAPAVDLLTISRPHVVTTSVRLHRAGRPDDHFDAAFGS